MHESATETKGTHPSKPLLSVLQAVPEDRHEGCCRGSEPLEICQFARLLPQDSAQLDDVRLVAVVLILSDQVHSFPCIPVAQAVSVLQVLPEVGPYFLLSADLRETTAGDSVNSCELPASNYPDASKG